MDYDHQEEMDCKEEEESDNDKEEEMDCSSESEDSTITEG